MVEGEVWRGWGDKLGFGRPCRGGWYLKMGVPSVLVGSYAHISSLALKIGEGDFLLRQRGFMERSQILIR